MMLMIVNVVGLITAVSSYPATYMYISRTLQAQYLNLAAPPLKSSCSSVGTIMKPAHVLV